MKFASMTAFMAVAGVIAVGCSSSAPPPDPASTAPRSASELGPTGVPTRSSDMTSMQATPDVQWGANGDKSGGSGASASDKAALDKAQKEYESAKAALAKSPTDAKAKEHFTSIGAYYGDLSMRSDVLDRKVKYKQALHIFNEVLKVDPSNPVAKSESDMIIKIYKSLHRPIPKD